MLQFKAFQRYYTLFEVCVNSLTGIWSHNKWYIHVQLCLMVYVLRPAQCLSPPSSVTCVIFGIAPHTTSHPIQLSRGMCQSKLLLLPQKPLINAVHNMVLLEHGVTQLEIEKMNPYLPKHSRPTMMAKQFCYLLINSMSLFALISVNKAY